MPHLQTYSKFIILYDSSVYLFVPCESCEPLKVIDVKDVLSAKSLNPAKHLIDTLQISPCGKYLAITVQKELLLFSFPNLEILSSIAIKKTAFSMRFFNEQKVLLIADRSGSVYFFSYNSSLEKKPLCFGHNSMLTDALVSKDDRFIITADRDEKIRVTCYPNVYNIENYCLGHEMFVSNLSWLPINDCILASASGDGTIRIWDFLSGLQLCAYKVESACEEDAIVKLVCQVVKEDCCLAVQRYKTCDILILSLSGNIQKGFQIIQKHKINVENIVIDISFYQETLLYLVAGDKAQLQSWPEHSNIGKLSSAVAKHIGVSDLETYKILFKRYFDNVQEYHEKKRLRLMSQVCS